MKLPLLAVVQLFLCSSVLYGGSNAEQNFRNCDKSWKSITSSKAARDHDPAFISDARDYMSYCGSETSDSRRALLLGQMGTALVENKEYSEAIPILKESIRLAARSGMADTLAYGWEELGRASAYLGFCDGAVTAFDNAISLPATDNFVASIHRSAESWLTILKGPDLAKSSLKCTWLSKPSSSHADNSQVDSYGSGFFITSDGLLLTNDHVVEGCKSLSSPGGSSLQVVSRDKRDDLALLRGSNPSRAFIAFRSKSQIKLGDPVTAFGFPLPGTLSSSGVVTNGIVSSLLGFRDDPRTLQFSAAIQPGNSGGPLLDGSGHVIGVVEAKLNGLEMQKTSGTIPENVGFAIQWAQVRAFLDSEGIVPTREESSSSLESSEIASRAQSATIQIKCINDATD